jgi:hypothetical protein
MGQVTVIAQRTVGAPPERVRAALADYVGVRPKILTEHYSEYRVESGGQGAGTLAHWKLTATEKRVRDQLIEVSDAGENGGLVERDQNSSMITTWLVRPAEDDASTVIAHTVWQGAGGVGGFFEKIFAPLGLRRIHEGLLDNLDKVVRSA